MPEEVQILIVEINISVCLLAGVKQVNQCIWMPLTYTQYYRLFLSKVCLMQTAYPPSDHGLQTQIQRSGLIQINLHIQDAILRYTNCDLLSSFRSKAQSLQIRRLIRYHWVKAIQIQSSEIPIPIGLSTAYILSLAGKLRMD